MRVELAQVDACEGCGACCRHIGLPPFEVPNPDLGGMPVAPVPAYKAGQMALDTELFLLMPADLRAAHARLVSELPADPDGTPCAWLDVAAGRCRHYDWRPAVCRDWVPGSFGCNAARHENRQVVWRGDTGPDDWWNPRLPGRDESPAGHEPWDKSPPRWADVFALFRDAAIAAALVVAIGGL